MSFYLVYFVEGCEESAKGWIVKVIPCPCMIFKVYQFVELLWSLMSVFFTIFHITHIKYLFLWFCMCIYVYINSYVIMYSKLGFSIDFVCWGYRLWAEFKAYRPTNEERLLGWTSGLQLDRSTAPRPCQTLSLRMIEGVDRCCFWRWIRFVLLLW